jgi:hypothetical protein
VFTSRSLLSPTDHTIPLVGWEKTFVVCVHCIPLNMMPPTTPLIPRWGISRPTFHLLHLTDQDHYFVEISINYTTKHVVLYSQSILHSMWKLFRKRCIWNCVKSIWKWLFTSQTIILLGNGRSRSLFIFFFLFIYFLM